MTIEQEGVLLYILEILYTVPSNPCLWLVTPSGVWFYDQWWLLIIRTSKTPDQLFNIYFIGLSRHVGVYTDKGIVVIVSLMCNNSISQLYSILPMKFLISLVHKVKHTS